MNLTPAAALRTATGSSTPVRPAQPTPQKSPGAIGILPRGPSVAAAVLSRDLNVVKASNGPGITSPTVEQAEKARINSEGQLNVLVEHIIGHKECPPAHELVKFVEDAAGLFEKAGSVSSTVFTLRYHLDNWISQPNFFENEGAAFIKFGLALEKMKIAGHVWKNAEARRPGARGATERDPIGSQNPGTQQSLQSNIGGGQDGKSPAEHFQSAVGLALGSSSSGKSNETFVAEITAAAVLYKVVKRDAGSAENVKGNVDRLRQTLERDFPTRVPGMTYVQLKALGEAATVLGLHGIAALAHFAVVQKHPGSAGTSSEFTSMVIQAADAFDALKRNSVELPADVRQAKDAMEERTNRWLSSAELHSLDGGLHPSLTYAFRRLSFDGARQLLEDENARRFDEKVPNKKRAPKVAPRANLAAREPVVQQGPDKSPNKSPNANRPQPGFAGNFYKTNPVVVSKPAPPVQEVTERELASWNELLGELELDERGLRHLEKAGFSPSNPASSNRPGASSSTTPSSLLDPTDDSDSGGDVRQSESPSRRRDTFDEKYPSGDAPRKFGYGSHNADTPSGSQSKPGDGDDIPLIERAEPQVQPPRVQPPTAQPQPAQRTTFQKAQGAARSFANFFTRADAKRRRVDAQVGRLLSELAKPQTDATKAQVGDMLNGMPRTMRPLTGGKPDSYEAQFGGSVQRVLEKAGTEQVRSVYEHVTKQIENKSIDPHLRLIQAEAATRIENLDPTLSPLLREKLILATVAAGNGDKAAAARHYQAAFDKARELIAEHGGAAINVIIDALFKLTTEQDSIKQGMVDVLLGALPPDALAGLAARVPDEHETPQGASIRATARENASERTRWARTAFTRAGDDPVNLARAVVTAAQSYGVLIGGERDQWGTQELLEPVLKLLAAPRALEGVPVDDLVKLDAALASMGIADCRGEIADAIAFHAIAALSEIATPITDGREISAALIAFKAVMQKASGIEFREHLQSRVSQMAPEARFRLAFLMQDPRMIEFSAAMPKMQTELRRQKYDVEAGNLQDLHLALNTVRTAADPFPKARLLRGPAAIGNPESLTPVVRTALLQACNIEVGPTGQVNVKSGIAPTNVLQALERNHRKIMEDATPGTTEPDVADAFRDDVGVHDIRINGESLVENMDQWRRLDESSRAGSRQAGVNKLRVLTHGNSKMLHAITSVANARAVAGAMQPRFGLPDGRRGELLGDPQIQSNIVFNASGGCVVSMVVDISDAKQLVVAGPSGRESVVLRKGAFAHFTYEVAISPEGVISVADPAAPRGNPAPMLFKYEAQADEQSKRAGRDYPTPQNADDLVGPGAARQAKSDFRDQLKSEYSDENYRFLDDLNEFNEYHSELVADRIWNQYFRHGAESEVNVSGDARKAVHDTYAQMNQPPSQSELANFVEALERVRLEVNGLLDKDPKARFLKGWESEPPVQAAAPTPVIDDRKTNLTNRDVGRFLHSLSQPFAGDVTVAAEALVHLKKVSNRGIWRGNSVEFRQLVEMNLKGLKPHQLVALRYNLENNVSPAKKGVMYQLNRQAVKDDPEIKALYAAVVRMLDAMPEATATTPESVMLTSLAGISQRNLERGTRADKFDHDVGMLAGWFAQGRVSRSEVAAAFAKMSKPALLRIYVNSAKYPGLAPIAQNILTVRKAGVRFIDDISAKQRELNDERDLLNRVVSLAGLFDSYTQSRAVFGVPMSDSDAHVEEYREQVATKVEELLQSSQFEIARLPIANIWELRSAMVILGVDAGFVKIVDDLLLAYANDGAVQTPVARRPATPAAGRTLRREPPPVARPLLRELDAAGVTPSLLPGDDDFPLNNVDAPSPTPTAPENALSESPEDGVQVAFLDDHLVKLEQAVQYRAPARLGSPRAAIDPGEFMSDVIAASEFFQQYESGGAAFSEGVRRRMDVGKAEYEAFLQSWTQPTSFVSPTGVRDLTIDSVAALHSSVTSDFVSALSHFGVADSILAKFAPPTPALPAGLSDDLPQLPPQMAQPPQLLDTESEISAHMDRQLLLLQSAVEFRPKWVKKYDDEDILYENSEESRVVVTPTEFVQNVIAASAFFNLYESNSAKYSPELQKDMAARKVEYAALFQSWAEMRSVPQGHRDRDVSYKDVAGEAFEEATDFISALTRLGVDRAVVRTLREAIPRLPMIPAGPQNLKPQPTALSLPQIPTAVVAPKGSRFGLPGFLGGRTRATTSSTPPRQSDEDGPRVSSHSSASRPSSERDPLARSSAQKAPPLPPRKVVETVRSALLAYAKPMSPDTAKDVQFKERIREGGGILMALTVDDDWKNFRNSRLENEALREAVETAVKTMRTEDLVSLCAFIKNSTIVRPTADMQTILDVAQAQLQYRELNDFSESLPRLFRDRVDFKGMMDATNAGLLAHGQESTPVTQREFFMQTVQALLITDVLRQDQAAQFFASLSVNDLSALSEIGDSKAHDISKEIAAGQLEARANAAALGFDSAMNELLSIDAAMQPRQVVPAAIRAAAHLDVLGDISNTGGGDLALARERQQKRREDLLRVLGEKSHGLDPGERVTLKTVFAQLGEPADQAGGAVANVVVGLAADDVQSRVSNYFVQLANKRKTESDPLFATTGMQIAAAMTEELRKRAGTVEYRYIDKSGTDSELVGRDRKPSDILSAGVTVLGLTKGGDQEKVEGRHIQATVFSRIANRHAIEAVKPHMATFFELNGMAGMPIGTEHLLITARQGKDGALVARYDYTINELAGFDVNDDDDELEAVKPDGYVHITWEATINEWAQVSVGPLTHDSRIEEA